MEWIQYIQTLIVDHLNIGIGLQNKIFQTVFIIVFCMGIRTIMRRIFDVRIKDTTRRYIAAKTLSYTTGFIVFLLLVHIWMGKTTGIAAYLGLLSAGIAIALQAPLTNLAGWLFISVRKPFTVGDRIQVGSGTAGDVIDIRPFSFSLIEIGNWVHADQSTGRIIHVPNGETFKTHIANYTQGFNFVWDEIPVTITFESDWRKAKKILTTIAQDHTAVKSDTAAKQVKRAARKYLIFFRHLTPIVWTSVADIGVVLTIRYLSEPRKRRASTEQIWEDILDAFEKEENIDLAYPTVRYYDNVRGGKATTG